MSKHVKTLPRAEPDTITVFEHYKGFSIWFDEISSQYMTMINNTPVNSYRIYDLEREIDFYIERTQVL